MTTHQVNITLGTAGHVDHGKTLLVHCLTGCETDRLKEEKERGMSIDLGFAPCRIDEWEVGIVDVPGHEDFIRTMVAGAVGMDGVIFVVAADDGVMPQTREHLDILTLLGIRHGIVALTKVDRVDPDLLEIVQSELQDFLRGTFLEAAPIVPVSCVTGQGFGPLWSALSCMVHSIKPRRAEGVFRMPINRSFSVKGYGTVVSGIPVSGSAKVGDELLLMPQGQRGRIRAVQAYGRSTDVVQAGQCSAVNVPDWDSRAIVRGNTVALPGYFEPQEWYVCRLQLLPHLKVPLKNGARVRFHTGMSDVNATVYLSQGDRLAAGESGIVQVRLADPIVAGPGDGFIVRSLSPVQTMGGGIVVEGTARRLKRRSTDRMSKLADRAAAIGDDTRFVECHIRTAEGLTVGESDLSVRTKLLPVELKQILSDLVHRNSVLMSEPGIYVHRSSAEKMGTQLVAILDEYHRQTPRSTGISPDELQKALAIDRAVLDLLIDSLKKDGRLIERHQRLALPAHQEALSDEDRQQSEAIEESFRKSGFRPPDATELVETTSLSVDRIKGVIGMLVEHERLVQVDRDLFFHREAVDRARSILVDTLQKEGRLESVRFKYLLDTSRKFAIPLLDYFDRIGVTRQVNHTRYLRSP